MKQIENAKISSTFLGIEDHGIFSFTLMLDYGGSGQGAGQYCLDAPMRNKKGDFVKRVGTAKGCDVLLEILRTLEVDSWEKLKGVHLRAEHDYGKVYRIGHILKNKWLDFESFFAEKSTPTPKL